MFVKIQWSNEEIANLSDVEFQTLIIRMLTEMVEYGRKIKEKVKAMKSEIQENAQGANSEGKETGTQINGLHQKEEMHIQPEQNEETRIQKKWREAEDSLGQPETFQHPNYRGAKRENNSKKLKTSLNK